MSTDGLHPDTNKAVMAVILAHEIAHTLGLGEVNENEYGDAALHEGADGMQCIMEGLHYSTIYTLSTSGTSALCDDCRDKLHQCVPLNAYQN